MGDVDFAGDAVDDVESWAGEEGGEGSGRVVKGGLVDGEIEWWGW
jgi:hypothetical protein